MSFILLGILNAQAEAAGGGAAYDLLETTVLSSNTPSVTFSSLDTLAADYEHLQLRMTLRDDRSGLTGSGMAYTFNGDTTNSYAVHQLGGDGSSAFSANLSSRANIGAIESVTGASATSGNFGAAVADILDFSSTTKNTTLRHFGGIVGGTDRVILASGGYFKTDAITSVTVLTLLGNNLIAGSRISLYGIKAA